MIARADLDRIAHARLEDAAALLQADRFDTSVYICGYAVEIALKAKICDSLRWTGYPGNNAEFQGYASFRTHNLVHLLHLSGVEAEVTERFLAEWSIVADWEPEMRYIAIGSFSSLDASAMLIASRTLVGAI